jgi:hypothetical protein
VLVGLEHLVDVEEVFDLVEEMRTQVVERGDVVVHGVVDRHADDLGVGALLVFHPEHAERAGAHPAARERRVFEEHEGVERIAVFRERVGDEAVVGGIDGGGEQPAIESDHVMLVVVLVLVATAARDLHHHVERAVGAIRLNHGRTLRGRASPRSRR